MRQKVILITLGCAGLGLLLLITLTNPTSLSSTILLVPFLLLFIIIWCVAFSISRSLGVARARAIRLPFIFAGVPTGLLLLQSIGQLTIWDAVIVLIFALIMYFYVTRMTAKLPD